MTTKNLYFQLLVVIIAIGLASCGGSGDSAGSDAQNNENSVPTGVNTGEVTQSINASTSVDCELSASCRWVSPDAGLSISITDGDPFFFTIESTRDTKISITPYVAARFGSEDLQLDAFDIEGRRCSIASCEVVSRDLPAGRPVFIRANRDMGFSAPHRTDFSVIALEFSEQDGETQFAVFRNVDNKSAEVHCTSGQPCTWRNESDNLQVELNTLYPEPQETISFDVGEGAITVRLAIRNYTGSSLKLTSGGNISDTVALNGLVRYQLFYIARANASIGFIVPADQDFRDPDISLAVPALESPREDLYRLILTIPPSGFQTADMFLEELSFALEDEQGVVQEKVTFRQITYQEFQQ